MLVRLESGIVFLREDRQHREARRRLAAAHPAELSPPRTPLVERRHYLSARGDAPRRVELEQRGTGERASEAGGHRAAASPPPSARSRREHEEHHDSNADQQVPQLLLRLHGGRLWSSGGLAKKGAGRGKQRAADTRWQRILERDRDGSRLARSSRSHRSSSRAAQVRGEDPELRRSRRVWSPAPSEAVEDAPGELAH